MPCEEAAPDLQPGRRRVSAARRRLIRRAIFIFRENLSDARVRRRGPPPKWRLPGQIEARCEFHTNDAAIWAAT